MAPVATVSGAALPIDEAEALLATLPGVISVRVVATRQGAVGEVHVLTGAEVPPRQTVRNVGMVYIDAKGVGRRALLKRAGKGYIKCKLGGKDVV